VRLLPTGLEGPALIEPNVYRDERGFFLETFRQTSFRALGIECEFVQDNHSRSRRGTLRGLHYQTEPGQAKLVRVARGRILDVAVDIRLSSPTFGQHIAFELDDVLHRQLFVPVGFAHGFLVLSAEADVVYKVGSYYDLSTERGLAWNDPDIGIPWPIEGPTLSDRDLKNPRLQESDLPEW
jgi:dTDP-4-dehydrorhamnose 3,5-epimerase